MQYTTKHSGKKERFKDGADREVKVGRPRFDLIPPHAMLRIANLFARGAEIYGDRNWEKGLPFSSIQQSKMRHIEAHRRGETDEDHLAAEVWNALVMMEFECLGRKDLDDLPKYTCETK